MSRRTSTSLAAAALVTGMVLGLPGVAGAAPGQLKNGSERAMSASAPRLADAFSRGSGTTWPGWTLVGAHRAAAADGHGIVAQLEPGTSFRATVDDFQQSDVTARATFFAPASGPTYYSAQARTQADGRAYRATAVIDAEGRLLVSLRHVAATGAETVLAEQVVASGVTAGAPVAVAVRVTGTHVVTVSGMAWLGGDAPGWQVSATDASAQRIATAGGAGVNAYLARGAEACDVVTEDFEAGGAVMVMAPVTSAPLPDAVPAPSPTSPTTQPTTSPTTPAPSTPAPTTPVPTTPVPTTPAPTTPAPTTPAPTTPAPTTPAPTTPAPTSPPTTPAPTTPAPEVPAAGAARLGSTSYPVPSDAIVVAPLGNDAAAGTIDAPVRTIARAVEIATPGRTVVLRGGTYHESVRVPNNKPLAFQSHPGEVVWMDGSSIVTGFSRDGDAWVKSGWTAQFDSSPTFAKGAPDGTTDGWRFVNPAFPMAAHPDMVWIDGKALRQVGSRAEVGTGTFYVDYALAKLYVGSDPTDRDVRGSTLARAMYVGAPGTSVRGIGIRRYANSVWMRGALTADTSGTTVENVVISDNATGGLGLFGANSSVRSSTISGNGHLGIQANEADNLVVDRVLVQGNDSERFNAAPVAGGLKVTTLRGFRLTNSVFDGNYGNGVWCDESVHDMTITGNVVRNTANRGIFLELSSKAVVANNLVVGSGGTGIRITDTDKVQVWNNTVSGTGIPVEVTQDDRTPAGHRYATDARRPFPDPDMTWVSAQNTFGNNVFQAAAGPNRMLSVEDFTKKRAGADMVRLANGNVYSQPSGSTAKWLVVWSRVGTDPAVFTDLGAFRSVSGHEVAGVHLRSAAVDAQGGLVTPLAAGVSAQSLPEDVARDAGLRSDMQALGYVS